MLTRAQHGREKYPPLPPCLFSWGRLLALEGRLRGFQEGYRVEEVYEGVLVLMPVVPLMLEPPPPLL